MIKKAEVCTLGLFKTILEKHKQRIYAISSPLMALCASGTRSARELSATFWGETDNL